MPETPSGVPLLYEEFRSIVLRQLADAEALDRKLGVAIAALVATTGAVYAARPPVVIGALLASWLLVGLVQAVRGFSYQDRFTDGPNAAFYRARQSYSPEVIKWHALVSYEEAMKINERHLKTKGRRLTDVVLALGLVAGLSLAGKMLGLG